MKQVGFWALISLTLGLAPFSPEPHILGKLRWIAGGAEGMAWMDYFDLLLHAFPWVMLVVAAVMAISKSAKTETVQAPAE